MSTCTPTPRYYFWKMLAITISSFRAVAEPMRPRVYMEFKCVDELLTVFVIELFARLVVVKLYFPDLYDAVRRCKLDPNLKASGFKGTT